MKGQIITNQATLSTIYHSKNVQIFTDMVKAKLLCIASFSIFQKFKKTHLSIV